MNLEIELLHPNHRCVIATRIGTVDSVRETAGTFVRMEYAMTVITVLGDVRKDPVSRFITRESIAMKITSPTLSLLVFLLSLCVSSWVIVYHFFIFVLSLTQTF